MKRSSVTTRKWRTGKCHPKAANGHSRRLLARNPLEITYPQVASGLLLYNSGCHGRADSASEVTKGNAWGRFLSRPPGSKKKHLFLCNSGLEYAPVSERPGARP